MSGGYVADNNELSDVLRLARSEAARVLELSRATVALALPPLSTLDRIIRVSSCSTREISGEVRRSFASTFHDLRPYEISWSITSKADGDVRVYASLCRKSTLESYRRVTRSAGFSRILLMPHVTSWISRVAPGGQQHLTYSEGDGVERTIVLRDGLPVDIQLKISDEPAVLTSERPETHVVLNTRFLLEQSHEPRRALKMIAVALLLCEICIAAVWSNRLSAEVEALRTMTTARVQELSSLETARPRAGGTGEGRWSSIYRALPADLAGVTIDGCTVLPSVSHSAGPRSRLQVAGEGSLSDICMLEARMYTVGFASPCIMSLQRKGDLYSFVITADWDEGT